MKFKVTGWYLGIYKVKVVVYSNEFPLYENNGDIFFCDVYHLYNSHCKVTKIYKIRRESKENKINSKTEAGLEWADPQLDTELNYLYSNNYI